MTNKTSFAAALLAAYAVVYAGASSARSDNDDHDRAQRSAWQHVDQRHDGRDDNRRDDRHDGRGNDHHDKRRDDDHRDYRQDGRHDGRHDDRHDSRYDNDHHDSRHREVTRYRTVTYRRPPGYQVRHWDRGHTLPASYRSSYYVVNDYQRYQLYAPRRDQRWVRVDNDAFLIQASTGLINVRVGNLFY